METTCTWNEKLHFTAKFGEHEVPMDTKAPLSSDKAASPKQIVLAAICGCTGMDVVSLLRKAKQNPAELTIDAHTDLTEGQPSIFKAVHLTYRVQGPVDKDVIIDAVKQSMTKYCGVSAMIAKACPITYEIQLNGAKVAEDKAKF